jgi:hypothetical protein
VCINAQCNAKATIELFAPDLFGSGSKSLGEQAGPLVGLWSHLIKTSVMHTVLNHREAHTCFWVTMVSRYGRMVACLPQKLCCTKATLKPLGSSLCVLLRDPFLVECTKTGETEIHFRAPKGKEAE